MAVYAIGDVQGCYDTLARLIEKINFNPAQDRLWFCGDLVNRGGQSLEVLRLVKSLAPNVIAVLGNHDLSLLAISIRDESDQHKANTDLKRILFAEDRDDLLFWLRQRPLFHMDSSVGFAMVHAGLAPNWTLTMAAARSEEVSQKLRGEGFQRLLKNLFGDKPDTWSKKLTGDNRLRCIINVMTRMRYCNAQGKINLYDKGPPGTQKPGFYPWFEVPGHSPRELPIVCGHWSTLGLFQGLGIYSIDTGAVWGGKLTALTLTGEPQVISVISTNSAQSAKK